MGLHSKLRRSCASSMLETVTNTCLLQIQTPNTWVLQTLASASLIILYGFPCLRVTKFSSLLSSSFQRDILLTCHMTRLCCKGAIGAYWLQC
ncbi:hypothetical protein PVAP13_2KG492215 [Panicum virgatum]|uniref:Uncharacterized protein n=1 Tax=Panicum virgatum TaxID=38727 RepID=A0A8T0WEQ0_PANVG|nr:hypothetical protein PVAP13_2KG492215 [Panicum virgatum]